MLSEVFYTFLITSVIGCIMGILRMIYKSKCKRCSWCGITIERDIEAEQKIDELDIQRSKLASDSDKV